MPRYSIAVSRASRDALGVLAGQIKTARIGRRWSQKELAGRVGVDARTVAAVEAGSPGVAIGTVFNTAFVLGIDLFGLDGEELALARRRGEETLRLLPRLARSTHVDERGDDDF